MFSKKYDIIVVGGGHSGAEAAASAANLGSNVLLITMNLHNICTMSCNPSMGGIAKGQIIREIDALGGYSAIITDYSMIQFRMLNKSKGPAMWSPRAQCDRIKFSQIWKLKLEKIHKLNFFQDIVISLLIKKNKVIGVKTKLGFTIKGRAVILSNGTFLNGKIHIGNIKFNGGRIFEKQDNYLSKQLKNLGFLSGRMKTGTSPRVDGRSLDFSKMKEQIGDIPPRRFSYLNTKKIKKQKSCYITYTNKKSHEILQSGFNKSPIFNGSIKSKGPRYCPSIEEKIYRFSNKEKHQIFVEPDGWNSIEFYINGFSTSLPQEIQYKALKKISGFENVKIFRPGYAIEYDYFFPNQLKHSLETKIINNLFFAGQINGTTGYEEAAAQGLIAGINAHLKINEKNPFILKRNEAYIGVLIDDLTIKGTEEPYRMFTSRAEYRILLRQDNSDERLTPLSWKIGLINEERLKILKKKKKKIKKFLFFLKKQSIPSYIVNPILKSKKSSTIKNFIKAEILFRRPELFLNDFFNFSDIKKYIKKNSLDEEILERSIINIKYKGYIEKEKKNANKLIRLENIKIPKNFNYKKIISLSKEGLEKLIKYRPYSIANASRISGVSPSDISILLIYMKR